MNIQKNLEESKSGAEKKSSSTEPAEMQDYVSRQQRLEEIAAEEMEELSFIPIAVSQPRWALHMCDDKVQERRL